MLNKPLIWLKGLFRSCATIPIRAFFSLLSKSNSRFAENIAGNTRGKDVVSGETHDLTRLQVPALTAVILELQK